MKIINCFYKKIYINIKINVVYLYVLSRYFRGIEEVPETSMEHTEIQQIPAQQSPPATIIPDEVEYYVANYPYQTVEQGDLAFNTGDVITVLKKEGDWWTGKLGETIGIFPSNYVQKYEPVSTLDCKV